MDSIIKCKIHKQTKNNNENKFITKQKKISKNETECEYKKKNE